MRCALLFLLLLTTALAAQTYALGLYERAGYTTRGECFVDAGIEHLAMDKPLSVRRG